MGDLASDVHVALVPSTGMGHLTPSLRLAALFAQHNCHVTIITPQSTVSNAESKLISKFLSALPQVNHIQFQLLPPESNTNNSAHDHFALQYEAIRRSSHLLLPLLTSLSPPVSAFVYDVSLISPILPVANTLGVPHYPLFITGATFLAFFSYFPNIIESLHKPDVAVEIPGVSLTITKSSIPPMLLDPNNTMFKLFKEDSPKLTQLYGILINTSESLEPQALEALHGGRVIKGLPQIYPIGPVVPCEFEKEAQRGSTLKWLDDQPNGSVVYVSFGSKAVLGKEQIRELGEGLVRSGCRILWVAKNKVVDKDDEERIDEVLGIELAERIKEKGLVVKEWADQRQILDHKAVGGFLSHCGWNSVTEAAWYGVPILGWPQHGDQQLNAEVVLKGGWGVWKKDWGWSGERLVRGEEIANAINELMNNESLFIKATEVKNEARKAMGVGGQSNLTLHKLIQEWKEE